jgi:hypothetical protein
MPRSSPPALKDRHGHHKDAQKNRIRRENGPVPKVAIHELFPQQRSDPERQQHQGYNAEKDAHFPVEGLPFTLSWFHFTARSKYKTQNDITEATYQARHE